MAKRSRAKAARSAQLTLEDSRRPTGRGGWRPGAGRPRGRTRVAHVTRTVFAARHPQHVTLRLRDGVASLRKVRMVRAVRRAIAAGGHRATFRVIHFSVQSNHLHLVVEASGAVPLARGMQGLAVRLARTINHALARKGSLFAERYHARALRTPREVKHALRYVLLNARHHAAARGERLPATWIDPFSSAPWFDGWSHPIDRRQPRSRELLAQPRPTAAATVWLLTDGWWRHRGRLRFDDPPGPRAPAARRRGR